MTSRSGPGGHRTGHSYNNVDRNLKSPEYFVWASGAPASPGNVERAGRAIHPKNVFDEACDDGVLLLWLVARRLIYDTLKALVVRAIQISK